MATLKLYPGETAVVMAIDPDLYPDQGLPEPETPFDPDYGVDLGLGYLRPTHPIVIPPELPAPPIDPVDPAWGIDEDQGWLRPGGGPILPPEPPPAGNPAWEVKIAWTPVTGWVVVAVPTGEHVTPSKAKK